MYLARNHSQLASGSLATHLHTHGCNHMTTHLAVAIHLAVTIHLAVAIRVVTQYGYDHTYGHDHESFQPGMNGRS